VAENLGRRLAGHRAALGWTQQELADRIAISRVAVSHLEAGMSIPSERTIVLLAGVYKVDPSELVAGTDYPAAKAERLPRTTSRYTEVELQLALLERDLDWLDRTGADGNASRRLAEDWLPILAALAGLADDREAVAVSDARRRLLALVKT
jgi:transcriptional regulator with XRE-family HTH domain